MMQLEKPDPERVVLTARDPKGQHVSKTITVYSAAPTPLIEEIELFLKHRAEFKEFLEQRSTAAVA